jgi:hypothetical protein
MSAPFVGSPELRTTQSHRRGFIGGSDARIIMGEDDAALVRLWRDAAGVSLGQRCAPLARAVSGDARHFLVSTSSMAESRSFRWARRLFFDMVRGEASLGLLRKRG